MEKPPYLYHASQDRNIEIFKPRRESYRDPNEGSVVFATANEIYASMFLVRTDSSWVQIGFFNDVPYFVCSDKEKFMSLDRGGAIYRLPPDSFDVDLEKAGKVRQEFISKTNVKPMAKEIYESGFRAMIGMGVNIYFVDRDTFQRIVDSEDHGWSILENLNPEKL